MAEIPLDLREPLSRVLQDLVAGRVPDEQLTWVREYGDGGATLVPQPDAIWTHPYADAVRTAAGNWHVVVPLWTRDEAPSDLSAEIGVSADGTAELLDVRVM